MAESMIFFKCSLVTIIERYKQFSPGGVLEEEEKDVYKYKNVYMYMLSDDWSVIETENGECYAESILIQLAEENNIIYAYINEDLLEGELIIIEGGTVVRKIFDYYSTPELNLNIGHIAYEDNKIISSWIDIGAFTDYLYNVL